MAEGQFSNLFGNSKLEKIERGLKSSFSRIRNEFEDHLESINENTNELQANYELLLKLESRMEKLEHALADVDRFIRQFKSQHIYFIDDQEQNNFVIHPLTDEEKRFFQAIYELENNTSKITYNLLADTLGVSPSLVREYVTNLIEKGVPIVKRYQNQTVLISLESKFRDLQTRKGIIAL